MLTPEYLQRAPEELTEIFLELEESIIEDIARRISENLRLTETADYQLLVLAEMGYDLSEVEKAIAETSNLTEKQLEALIRKGSEFSYNDDRKRYKAAGKLLPALDNNPKMIDFIEAVIVRSKRDLSNLTNTMGFIENRSFKTINNFYRDALNNAVFQVESGAFSHQDILYRTVKKLGDSGIRTIDYASGRAYHVESAVRMNVLTSLSQITGHMSEANADAMDQDLMEITAHMGARPSHADWQGQIVSRSGRGGYLTLEDIGYESPDGFKGVNCRHDWFPYFEGISTPTYTKKDLEELEGDSIVFDGKEYTEYEATQRQRSLERSMRHTKRQIAAYEGAGLKDKALSAQIRLRGQRDLYNHFSKVAGIRPKWDRVNVYK